MLLFTSCLVFEICYTYTGFGASNKTGFSVFLSVNMKCRYIRIPPRPEKGSQAEVCTNSNSSLSQGHYACRTAYDYKKETIQCGRCLSTKLSLNLWKGVPRPLWGRNWGVSEFLQLLDICYNFVAVLNLIF